MAKAQFYLDIEGEKLRGLDDMRENFSIENIAAAYENIPLRQEGQRENVVALFGSISDDTFCCQPELPYALDAAREGL